MGARDAEPGDSPGQRTADNSADKNAKLYCKVDVTTDDPLFGLVIQAAREYGETFTGRKFITQTWDDKRPWFPADGAIELPFAPTSSVTSVSYIDTTGSSQTWSSALYETDLPSGPKAMPGRIQPIYGGVYPSTREVFNAVTIRAVYGYGSTVESIPARIRLALLLLIAHMYEKREASVAPGEVSTADAMLWEYLVARPA